MKKLIEMLGNVEPITIALVSFGISILAVLVKIIVEHPMVTNVCIFVWAASSVVDVAMMSREIWYAIQICHDLDDLNM